MLNNKALTSGHFPLQEMCTNTSFIGSQDQKLLDAAQTAMDTGNMTPLIKEELKYTIQSRRLAEGKSEIRVHFEEPKPAQLTEEEVGKVEKRREQNRLAAQRFRRKQKVAGEQALKRLKKLESDNTRLRTELRVLRMEKELLQKRLNEHLSMCPGIIYQTRHII